MLIKAASLVTVANASGEALGQASMLRYLNEMMWFPTAFLGDNVSFEAVDDHAARVTLTDHGRTATATARPAVAGDDGRRPSMIPDTGAASSPCAPPGVIGGSPATTRTGGSQLAMAVSWSVRRGVLRRLGPLDQSVGLWPPRRQVAIVVVSADEEERWSTASSRRR
jgi:hypothetical protein